MNIDTRTLLVGALAAAAAIIALYTLLSPVSEQQAPAPTAQQPKK